MANAEIQRQLTSGEVLLIDTRQHWVALIRFAFRPLLIAGVGVLLSILNQWMRFERLGFINDILHWIIVILFVVAIVWLPMDIVRWWSRHYVLTNRRAMRMDGVLRKQSFDSSLEQINDIGLSQSFLGRQLGYADLTLLTANASNEAYRQLLDGPQFKRAVLDAKDAIRSGRPLDALPDGFVVKGGTNEASRRAASKGRAASDDAGAAMATGTGAAAGASAAVVADETDASPAMAPGMQAEPEAEATAIDEMPAGAPVEDTGAAEAPPVAEVMAEDEAFAEWPEAVETHDETPVAEPEPAADAAPVEEPSDDNAESWDTSADATSDEVAVSHGSDASEEHGDVASQSDESSDEGGEMATVTSDDGSVEPSSEEDRPAT